MDLLLMLAATNVEIAAVKYRKLSINMIEVHVTT